MKRGIVVYYSLDGNTKFIADKFSKVFDLDCLRLEPKKDIKSKGFMKIIWGGKDVITKKEPELKPLKKKIDNYDVVFIGTPVWVGTFAPAIRTFLKTFKGTKKKIVLFCTYGGSVSKTFNDFESHIRGGRIIGKLGLKEPLKFDSDLKFNKFIEFIKPKL